jgi:hypothetical protein
MRDTVIHEARDILPVLQGYICDDLSMAAGAEDNQS